LIIFIKELSSPEKKKGSSCIAPLFWHPATLQRHPVSSLSLYKIMSNLKGKKPG